MNKKKAWQRYGSKRISDKLPPKTPVEKQIALFTTSTRTDLSPEEFALFQGIDAGYRALFLKNKGQHLYKEMTQRGGRNVVLWENIDISHLMNAGVWERIERDAAAGIITPAQLKEIQSKKSKHAGDYLYDQMATNYATVASRYDFDPVKARKAFAPTISALKAAEKPYIQRIFDEELPGILQCARTYHSFSTHGFFEQWATGNFTYTQPLFRNEEELTRFVRLISYSWNLWTDEKTKFMIDRGPLQNALIKQLSTRLTEHEKPLWEEAQRREAEYQRQMVQIEQNRLKTEEDERRAAEEEQKKATQAAQERINAKNAERAAFMLTQQPYTKEHWENGAVLRQKLVANSRSASVSMQATTLIRMADEAALLIDRRNPHLLKLGGILLSAANLASVARVQGLESQVANIKRAHPRSVIAMREQLSYLYRSRNEVAGVAEVSDVIEQLLERDAGIVLFCALTQTPTSCAELLECLSRQETLRANIAKQRAGLQSFGWSDAFIDASVQEAAYDKDPNIVSLKAVMFNLVQEEQQATRLRVQLAQEIKQAALEEEISTNVTFPGQAQVPAFEIPSHLAKILEENKDWCSAERSPRGDKYFTIASTRFPHKRIDVEYASTHTLSVQIEQLHAQCNVCAENVKTIRSLTSQYGFEQVNKGNRTVMLHKEYDIEQEIGNPDEKEENKQLAAAVDAFDEGWFKQEKTLETAGRAGIKMQIASAKPDAKGPIVLSHDIISGGSIQMAADGYLNRDEFTLLQDYLNKLSSRGHIYRKFQSAFIPPQEESLVTKHRLKEPLPWSPESGQTAMILDTNTVERLTAPRARTGSDWFDMMKCTSYLPGVTVIIPAVVADWELQGRIPVYDNGKRSFMQVDERYEKKPLKIIAEAVSKALQHASRARMAEDGSIMLEEGANPHIIIMETADDRKLYDRVQAIEKLNLRPRARQELRSKTLHHQGEGEKAMNRIAKALPDKVAAMLVSDDIMYFHHHAPRTTHKGMPIGHASTVCYVDAEIAARGPDLSRPTGTSGSKPLSDAEGLLSGEYEAVTLMRVSDSMAEHQSKRGFDKGLRLIPYAECGKYKGPSGKDMAAGEPPPAADTIYTLIARGVKQAIVPDPVTAAEEVKSPSARSGWAAAGLKNTVSEKPIKPAKANERPPKDRHL